MAVCLQALLGLKVEKLERPALGLESYDGFSQMHDGAVGANGSPDDIVCVLEVDDDGLGGSVGLVVDLAHAYILVGLECLKNLSVHVRRAGGAE
jgi:hypothetical protein